jgi:hypothetical protein
MPDISEDPRLSEQEDYFEGLMGVTLHKRTYFLWQQDWDHDHCEFCSARFVVSGDKTASPEALTAGWTTDDEYQWICDGCFRDFHEHFGWTIRERSARDRPDTPPPAESIVYTGEITKKPPTRRRRSPRP